MHSVKRMKTIGISIVYGIFLLPVQFYSFFHTKVLREKVRPIVRDDEINRLHFVAMNLIEKNRKSSETDLPLVIRNKAGYFPLASLFFEACALHEYGDGLT